MMNLRTCDKSSAPMCWCFVWTWTFVAQIQPSLCMQIQIVTKEAPRAMIHAIPKQVNTVLNSNACKTISEQGHNGPALLQHGHPCSTFIFLRSKCPSSSKHDSEEAVKLNTKAVVNSTSKGPTARGRLTWFHHVTVLFVC